MKNITSKSIITSILFSGLLLSSCQNSTQRKGQTADTSVESKVEAAPEANQTAEVVNITPEAFQTLVSSQPFVVIDFHATWCRPCKVMAPHLEKIEGEYEETQLKIVKIDIDKNQQIAAHFAIKSIPTMKLFKNGKEVDTRIGGLNESQLRQLFAAYL
ncbi:MAG: thioredoxin 1 [Bacteroidia bacterium]|jgi:thioredoxin 1